MAANRECSIRASSRLIHATLLPASNDIVMITDQTPRRVRRSPVRRIIAIQILALIICPVAEGIRRHSMVPLGQFTTKDTYSRLKQSQTGLGVTPGLLDPQWINHRFWNRRGMRIRIIPSYFLVHADLLRLLG